MFNSVRTINSYVYVTSYTATVYSARQACFAVAYIYANSKDVRTCNCYNEILAVLLEYIYTKNEVYTTPLV